MNDPMTLVGKGFIAVFLTIVITGVLMKISDYFINKDNKERN